LDGKTSHPMGDRSSSERWSCDRMNKHGFTSFFEFKVVFCKNHHFISEFISIQCLLIEALAQLSSASERIGCNTERCNQIKGSQI
jgi:hypothetical protein